MIPENRMLRRLLGLTGLSNRGCRKLHIEVVCNSYYSHMFIRMITWRRMRWARRTVACVEEKCL
jgi:hypothetical protein